MTPKKLKKIIRAARGEIPADLVLKGGRVVNVFTCEIVETDVALTEGTIVGLGAYEGQEVFDCRRRFIVPGFIDGHFHVESTLLTPAHLAPVLLPLGTTTLISDPHEIANVLGLPGIAFMLQDSRNLPLEYYWMAPSCVPATSLETAGAVLEMKDLLPLRRHPRILGLGEMMNFPGVIRQDPAVLKKLIAFRKGIIDGHAPLLTGKDLCAYRAGGPRSDHECTLLSEAKEKLSLGLRIMIREGSLAKNLNELLPLVMTCNARNFLLVTDDRHPDDLVREGHINYVLRQAVGLGLNPLLAVQMATLNAAEHFGLRHLGAVAPGYQADLAVIKTIPGLEVEAVFKRGTLVARNGAYVGPSIKTDYREQGRPLSIKDLTPERFEIPIQGKRAQVIELIPDQILTRRFQAEIHSRDGKLRLEPEEDLVILACVERHQGSGNVGLGLVKGFGLRQGALASSVAHDSHQIVVIGRDPTEMFLAVKTVEALKGGLVVVGGREVTAQLPLPIAGLMSDQPLKTVIEQKDRLLKAAAALGCQADNPFMALSFLALPVIPELRLTDRGLVDVRRMEIIPLFVE
jgi:adenine deaminase